MNIVSQFGSRVKFLRKQLGISQLELSLRAGVSKNYICDLEKGRRNPSLETMERISLGLNISLEELMKGLQSFEE